MSNASKQRTKLRKRKQYEDDNPDSKATMKNQHTENKKYAISDLTNKHIQAINFIINGWDDQDIAKELDIPHLQLTKWKVHPLFIDKYYEILETNKNQAELILKSSILHAAKYISAATNINNPNHTKTNFTGLRAAAMVLDYNEKLADNTQEMDVSREELIEEFSKMQPWELRKLQTRGNG